LGLEISSPSFPIARFYDVAANGEEANIQYLLADNIPLETKHFKRVKLLYVNSQAACQGHEQLVKLLLENPNVDVDARDENGRSALFYAVESLCPDIVKLLSTSGKIQPSRIKMENPYFYRLRQV
jgi:Ankyrin repeats (3 copies)